MNNVHVYCEEPYVFCSDLQEIFHKWRNSGSIRRYNLHLPKTTAPVTDLQNRLSYLRSRREKVDIPSTGDFFLRNLPAQMDAMLKDQKGMPGGMGGGDMY